MEQNCNTFGARSIPSIIDLVSYQSRHLLKCVSRPMESIVGTKIRVQAHWRKNARKLVTILLTILLTIFLTNFHLANEMVCFLQCSGK